MKNQILNEAHVCREAGSPYSRCGHTRSADGGELRSFRQSFQIHSQVLCIGTCRRSTRSRFSREELLDVCGIIDIFSVPVKCFNIWSCAQVNQLRLLAEDLWEVECLVYFAIVYHIINHIGERCIVQKIKEKYDIRNTFYVKLCMKLTLTCARYLMVPLPVGSPTNPVRT